MFLRVFLAHVCTECFAIFVGFGTEGARECVDVGVFALMALELGSDVGLEPAVAGELEALGMFALDVSPPRLDADECAVFAPEVTVHHFFAVDVDVVPAGRASKSGLVGFDDGAQRFELVREFAHMSAGLVFLAHVAVDHFRKPAQVAFAGVGIKDVATGALGTLRGRVVESGDDAVRDVEGPRGRKFPKEGACLLVVDEVGRLVEEECVVFYPFADELCVPLVVLAGGRAVGRGEGARVDLDLFGGAQAAHVLARVVARDRGGQLVEEGGDGARAQVLLEQGGELGGHGGGGVKTLKMTLKSIFHKQ